MEVKKHKKINFIQDCGIYDYQFNVYVGWTMDEMVKDLSRFKDIDRMIDEVKKADFKSGGFVCYDEESKRVLWLPKWNRKWQELSNLTHEIHHLVFLLAKQKGFSDEIESQAYLFQYLLDSVYKKLNAK